MFRIQYVSIFYLTVVLIPYHGASNIVTNVTIFWKTDQLAGEKQNLCYFVC